MGLRYDKIVVIDLEAQCWRGNPPPGFNKDIIEIGVATVDLYTLKPERGEGIIVKPSRCQISEFCTKLTSITQEMVDQEGVPLGRACRRVMERYSGKRRVWGSWGNYDRNALYSECDERGVKFPLSQTHWNIKSIVTPLLGWDREMGLDRAIEELNLGFEGTHHRGGDDAYNTARILAHALQRARN